MKSRKQEDEEYEPHPEPEQLERYLRGESTREENARIVRYLLGHNQGKLIGQVVSESNEPLAGSRVSLMGGSLGAMFLGPRAHSNEQGSFAIQRLAAGSYLLMVEKEGFVPKETSITITPGGTVQVQVVLEPAAPPS